MVNNQGKSLVGVIGICVLCASYSLYADSVTVNFAGKVGEVNGPYASSFMVGEVISGSYAVDTTVPDKVLAPNEGRYDISALQSLRVNFGGGLSFEARGGPGLADSVTVFNDDDLGNNVFSDQLAYFGWDAVSGQIGGIPLKVMEVDFIEDKEEGLPTMLNNDGMPTGPFNFVEEAEGTVFLLLDDGTNNYTVVHFSSCAMVDSDGDGLADTCALDSDNDGVTDIDDNCPTDANPEQSDLDGDGTGDVCDGDIDGDGVLNGSDICPSTHFGETTDPSNGCTIGQLCPCSGPLDSAAPWRNKGAYNSCVTGAARHFFHLGLISTAQRKDIIVSAVRSECGRR